MAWSNITAKGPVTLALDRSATSWARRFELTPCPPSTVTVKLHWAMLPEPSEAWAWTDVTPIGNRLPEGGVTTKVTAEQGSVAVTLYVATAPLSSRNSSTCPLGQLSTGGVVSRTMTMALHVLEAPLSSATVRVTRLVPSGYGPGGTDR